MVSKTFACCTITKLLNSSSLRVFAVRAATAEALESGIEPAVFNSTGNRKFKASFSTRSRATSADFTLKILESSAQARSGDVQAPRVCSIWPKGVSARAAAEAEPPPELRADLDIS